jgi:hypothetical protein
VFSLTKSGEVWTLHYEVSPLLRLMQVVAGIAGIGVGIVESTAGPGPVGRLAVLLPALFVIGLMAYWMMSDASTTVIFDLKARRVEVNCWRPWFGAPRAYGFSDVALFATSESGESNDSWAAFIKPRDGNKIRLGSEAANRNERIRSYLEEIRRAAGIAEA